MVTLAPHGAHPARRCSCTVATLAAGPSATAASRGRALRRASRSPASVRLDGRGPTDDRPVDGSFSRATATRARSPGPGHARRRLHHERGRGRRRPAGRAAQAPVAADPEAPEPRRPEAAACRPVCPRRDEPAHDPRGMTDPQAPASRTRQDRLALRGGFGYGRRRASRSPCATGACRRALPAGLAPARRAACASGHRAPRRCARCRARQSPPAAPSGRRSTWRAASRSRCAPRSRAGDSIRHPHARSRSRAMTRIAALRRASWPPPASVRSPPGPLHPPRRPPHPPPSSARG